MHGPARIEQGAATGRGECVPYARYGETVESVSAALESVRERVAEAEPWAAARALPAGAARNALDCALWDLEAKRSGKPAYVLANLSEPRALTTAYTPFRNLVEKVISVTWHTVFTTEQWKGYRQFERLLTEEGSSGRVRFRSVTFDLEKEAIELERGKLEDIAKSTDHRYRLGRYDRACTFLTNLQGKRLSSCIRLR